MFCSALSIAYSRAATELWSNLAQLVLRAAYEATLWAAVVTAAERKAKAADAAAEGGPLRVYLTFIGGGVFGNRDEWIAKALAQAVAAVGDVELDVIMCHYASVDKTMEALITSQIDQQQRMMTVKRGTDSSL